MFADLDNLHDLFELQEMHYDAIRTICIAVELIKARSDNRGRKPKWIKCVEGSNKLEQLLHSHHLHGDVILFMYKLDEATRNVFLYEVKKWVQQKMK